MVKSNQQASSSSEGSGILKAKKEALAAIRLLRFKCVPGGMDIWMDHWRETMVDKKRVIFGKRVVKQRLPKALINLMVARPFRSIEDLTPVQLSKRSPDYRKLYALTTFVDGKVRDYEQALIDQYNAHGYAEDEIEVNDTDSKEDATVVKN